MLEPMGWRYVEWKTQAVCGLLAQEEIDNFSSSHRCTSGATLVRGASVLNTPARPAYSLASSLLRLALPWTSFAPIVSYHVLPRLVDVRLCP
jgi:hypothetical protein